MKQPESSTPFVDPATFSIAMGQATLLMTLSERHRDLPISHIEKLISPAILLKQFRLFSRGKQPVAFLVWASVSKDVEQQLKNGDLPKQFSDWRSGDHVVVVDCISPIVSAETFIEKFMASVRDASEKAAKGT